jgi:hypothetical protein
MGIVIIPGNRKIISVVEMESGHHKIWIDKTLNDLIQRAEYYRDDYINNLQWRPFK